MEQAPANASHDATPTRLWLRPEDESGTRHTQQTREESSERPDERTKVFQTQVDINQLEKTLSVEPTFGDLARESRVVGEVAPREFPLISKSWWKEVGEVLKASTVDKWLSLKELGERQDKNKLLEKKEKEIAQVKNAAAELEKSILEIRAIAEKEKVEAAAFSASLSSEELKRIFTGAVEKSALKTADQLQAKESQRVILGEQMATLSQEKETFKAEIQATEARLNQRIDGKVDEIKRAFSYDQQKEQRATLESAILDHKKNIEGNKQKIASYKKALVEGAKFLAEDPEAKATLEDIIEQMEDQVAEQTEQLAEAEKTKAGLDKNITAIEKKIGKWDRIRESYGLVPPAAKAAESNLQNVEVSSSIPNTSAVSSELPATASPEAAPAPPSPSSVESIAPKTSEQEAVTSPETIKQLIAYCEGTTEEFMKNQRYLEDTIWESSKAVRKDDQFIRDAYKTIGNLSATAPEADIREAMNEIKFSLTQDLRINSALSQEEASTDQHKAAA